MFDVFPKLFTPSVGYIPCDCVQFHVTNMFMLMHDCQLSNFNIPNSHFDPNCFDRI